MFVEKMMQSVAAVAAMSVAGAGVYAFQDAGMGGSPTAPEHSGFATGKVVTAKPTYREAYGDERAGSVADVVERLARRAAELEGQKRYSEAHAVVRELADVVGQWEGRLRAFTPPASDTAATGGGSKLAGSAFAKGATMGHPVIAPRPGASAGVGLPNPGAGDRSLTPVQDNVEQRLERVEQQLDEILKRLDRRADGDQMPKAHLQR
jgi:hypothetical protein